MHDCDFEVFLRSQNMGLFVKQLSYVQLIKSFTVRTLYLRLQLLVSMRTTFFCEQVSMTEKEDGVRKRYLGCANHIIIEKEAFLWRRRHKQVYTSQVPFPPKL